MKFNKISSLLIVAILVVLLSGCAGIKEQFGDIFRMIGELSKQYGHRDIGINIQNNKEMTVTFVNSPFNKLDKEKMEAKAREIALFSVGLLKEDSTIEELSIVFTIHEKKFLIVDYTETSGVYSFDVSELKKDLGKTSI